VVFSKDHCTDPDKPAIFADVLRVAASRREI